MEGLAAASAHLEARWSPQMEVGFAAAAAAAVESGASPLPVQVWLEQSLISNITKKLRTLQRSYPLFTCTSGLPSSSMQSVLQLHR